MDCFDTVFPKVLKTYTPIAGQWRGGMMGYLFWPGDTMWLHRYSKQADQENLSFLKSGKYKILDMSNPGKQCCLLVNDVQWHSPPEEFHWVYPTSGFRFQRDSHLCVSCCLISSNCVSWPNHILIVKIKSLGQWNITVTRVILGLRPANERCHYKVTPSPSGSAQT